MLVVGINVDNELVIDEELPRVDINAGFDIPAHRKSKKGFSIQTCFSRRAWEVANQEQSKLYETSLLFLCCTNMLKQDRAVIVIQRTSKAYFDSSPFTYVGARQALQIDRICFFSSMMYNALLLNHRPSYQSQL